MVGYFARINAQLIINSLCRGIVSFSPCFMWTTNGVQNETLLMGLHLAESTAGLLFMLFRLLKVKQRRASC